ncbi:hypothetical protein [Companilactobacillus mishanensis]|uniref:Uncharacterized protein n=1 Tax=Companilactobacillus mishanensis TaxID=2486008 RepID=A0A5P0ZKJ5_9LACO|nr:hypothetical protein [Companilactobacillus mishanensis]MQS53197.1 hypothetical protein [Companilactobacillus mishanensis]
MKDKKDLRSNTKSSKKLMLVAQIIAGITAVIFFVMLSRGIANAAISHKISNQYQDRDLSVLKAKTNNKSLAFIGRLMKSTSDVVITNENRNEYKKIESLIQDRKNRSKEVTDLFNGRHDYQDDVSKQSLDDLDNVLLNEKNQDVYQKQKNKLDTVRIWFEQTSDAKKYINKMWDKFNSSKSSLSIKEMSMLNTYYRLVRNRKVKQDLSDPVEQMNSSAKQNKGESSKVRAAKAELAELKNSPLTEKYKPANVDIVSSLKFSSGASDALKDAGITDKKVLYYDKSKDRLAIMTNVDVNYVASDGYVNVQSGQVSAGKYSIKGIIRNAGSSAAIVTDSSNSSFGKYIANADSDTLSSLNITNADNDTANFNSADPVFWFKNNSALSSSIYFGSGSTIGFIYSGGSSYSNGVQVNSSNLSQLQASLNSGILFFVK